MTNFNPQFEKIGDILIHDGCIDESQLAEALEEQKIKKGKIGHILLGRDIVIETARAMKKFPEDILIKLEHIILSHQGLPEKGLVTSPRFPEALFVHYIDELDGRMDQMLNAIEDDPNLRWTDRHNLFRHELYKK